MKSRATAVLCALLTVFAVSSAYAQSIATTVVEPSRHDTSQPLSELARMQGVFPGMFYTVPNMGKVDTRSANGGFEGPDAVMQAFNGSSASTILQNFPGAEVHDNGGLLAPPDPNGDVGPNHYVQMVNLVTVIFDKSGNVLQGPFGGNLFWAGFGGRCETLNSGDPVVLYDERADRWLITQFAITSSLDAFSQCIAVSTTPDPTGTYHRYEYDFTRRGLNDYPKFGIATDSYTMTLATFSPPPFFFNVQTDMAAFDRDAMLNGDPANMVIANVSNTDLGALPADLDGTGSMGALFASPMATRTTFDIWELDVDWANPNAASISVIANIPITNFDSDFCAASREACIPQPGAGVDLETLSQKLMHRLNVRDFGTHMSMVAAHSVDVGSGRAGMRWYEFRNSGSGWGMHQEGTYAPADGENRWMGSIAINAGGDIGLAYSVSSNSTNPGLRFTGQTADQSGTGIMNVAETTIINGTGVQTGTARWGDYSALAVDPTDNTTFWYTMEYGKVTGSFEWATQVAAFQLDGDPPPPGDVSITLTPTSSTDLGSGGGRVNYTLDIANDGDAAETVDIWLNISGPGGISITRGPVQRTIAAGGNLSVNLRQNIPGGAQNGTYTIAGSIGSFPTAEDSDSFDVNKGSTGKGNTSTTAIVNNWDTNFEAALSVEATEVPGAFSLEQNYPNPFNPVTVIAYELPQASAVTLKIYNLLGQEVATLVDGNRDAGRHEIRFDARSLSAGVYLYVIQADNFTSTKRMTLLK